MTVVWRGWCWGVSGDDVQSMCTALQDSRGENRRPQGIEVIAPRHEPTIPRAAMPGLGPGHKRRDAHCPFQLKSEEVLLQRLRRDPPSRRTLKSPPEVMLHTTQPGVSPQGERCLSGSPGRPLACNQNRKEPPSDHCATSTQNHQPK